MSKVRWVDTGKDSFFGDYVYAQVLDKDDFMVALRQLFDWGRYRERLLTVYRGKGQRGRPPYDPTLLLKMIFVSYLWNVSERDVERVATRDLGVKYFLELAVDERPPDHSSLTKFKNRLIRGREWTLIAEIFDDIIRQALEHGLELGRVQLLDSVHTQAHVNTEKDRDRQDQGQPPRDPDARQVHKGARRQVVDGESRTVEVSYHGFKAHSSINAATGIVTSLVPSLGNKADNKAAPELVAHDLALGVPCEVYGGDKAYDDGDLRYRLREQGLLDGFCLRAFRLHKQDDNRQVWEELARSPDYQEATGQRYRVEQPFGWVKDKHGFERCRYLGLLRYGLQAYFTFLVSNLKRIVKLLTGITLRPQAKGRRAEKLVPVYESLPWA
jgi:transposase, IS5 family